MGNWWKLALGGILSSALLVTGCGEASTAPTPGGSGKLKIVTTFYPMYEFSKQVAGDLADISVLVPAGTEPHDWEPTPKDVAKIAGANVFVYNGAGFESWVDSVVQAAEGPNLKIVEASKGIETIEGTAEPEEEQVHKREEHITDPHVWLDPVNAQREVANIADALAGADPAHADAYKSNAQAYLQKLNDLDGAYKQGLASMPNREFVTSHAAFGYLAKRYGLKQEPIAGISPDAEPSASEMKDIVAFSKAHRVKTIFFETLASPKVADAVAKEIGASTAVLNPLEGLTEEEKQSGLDYIGVMKQNLAELEKALS